MEQICIESVTITPNPVVVGSKYKIEVEIYALYPATDLFPATNVYPGADPFGIFPAADLYPENNLYPVQGGMSE